MAGSMAGSQDNEAQLLEQIDRMEEEHRAEIEHWKQRNADLIDKLKSKALQAESQRAGLSRTIQFIGASL